MDEPILASCRTCLGFLEVPINLFEPSYKNWLDVLQRLLAFPVYVEGRDFNVCNSCQRKLMWIFDFQIICLKSIESFRSHFDRKSDVAEVQNVELVHSVHIKSERSRSPVIDEDDESAPRISREIPKLDVRLTRSSKTAKLKKSPHKNEEIERILQDDVHEKTTIEICRKRKKRKRFDHYPEDQVLQALAECRSYMTDMKKLKCIFCDYIAKSSRILSVHIHSTHNSSANSWCARCNLQTVDLQVHLDTTKCTENRCVFCRKVFSRINALTEHLKLHSSSKMDDDLGLFEDYANEDLKTKPVDSGTNKNDSTLNSVNHFNKSTAGEDSEDDHVDEDQSQSSFSDNSDSDSDYEMENNHKCKKQDKSFGSEENDVHLRSRNKQFPFNEVLKAIKEVNSFMTEMKNRQCIFCNFVGGNAVALRKHVNTTHKNANNWCKHCNIQAADLQRHRDTVRCHISQCTFCRKSFIFKKLYKFKDHLKTHCGKFVEEIESTYYKSAKVKLKQFAAHKVLRAIEETRYKKLKSSSRKIHCKLCSDSFTKMRYLRRHLRQHCQKELCRTKTSDMSNKPKLKRYKQFPKDLVMQAITDCKSFDMKCVQCDHIALSTRGLLFHMRGLHSSSMNNWCRRCNLQTDNLQRHLGTTKCSENRCGFCKKSFNRSDNLIVHLKLHYLTRTNKNSDLSDKVDDFQNSDGHCTICTKYFCNLKMHMVRKHNMPGTVAKKPNTEVRSSEEKHLCPICGKIFKTSSGVNYHVSSHYRDSKFKCSICGKCFFNRNVLKAHEKQHSEVKAFVCHICGKGSTHKATHLRHLETHEVGSVQCKICQKQFYRPGVLKLHMRHHTGENEYHCIPCGKSFHIKSLLRLHMEMHNDDDDRRYKCGVCGKGFKGRETLRRHKQIHTGVKRYKCSVCPFRSVQAQGLTTHMKQHPEDTPQANKPHKCLLCHRSFSTNALLMSHTDNCHRNNSKKLVEYNNK